MNTSQFDSKAAFVGGGFMPSQTTQGANSTFTPSKGLNRSYLSKYLIALLSYGGVPNEFFMDVLKRNLEDADHIYTKKRTAVRVEFGEMEQEKSNVEKFEKFTWKIENFSRLKTNKVCSEAFVIGGFPWKITLFPRGYENDKYVEIYLEAVKTANMSEGWSRVGKFKMLKKKQQRWVLVVARRAPTPARRAAPAVRDEWLSATGASRACPCAPHAPMRLYIDFGDFEFNASQTWCGGFSNIMELDKLNDPHMGFIVEDDFIFGAEIFVSKSIGEKHVNQAEFADIESNKEFEKFTWKIENFSHLNADYIFSEPFILCGYPWRIILSTKGKNGDNLCIFLEAMETSNMSKGWSRDVEYKLLLFNQVDTNRTITEVIVYNAKLEKPVKLEVPMSNLKTISPVSTHVDAELFSPTIEEVVDFNTVGQLEDVCSDNPSLVERPRKRSRKFNDLVFAALGRVLYFLKNGKVKDMNDKNCKDLQVLWDELEKFKFDLTWLEPHVQSALVLKSYVEKAIQVEKLMDNIVLLELETKRLKAKLAVVEVNVDIEKDLLKAKGIKEIDLDSELVFGSREFGETEQEKSSVEKLEKFTWKVENFSRLKTDEVYSEPFVIGGYPWKICLLRDDVVDGSLAIYLDAVETANMSDRWSRYVKFNSMQVIVMVDDACIVGAEVYVQMFSPSNEELMDFSSVGQIEKTDNPSLVEHLSKRSNNFADFAFAALGRIIHFLKTRKVKDMNDQACKDLQVLWDELEKFKFDLTWLELQVQYALGMKSYVEKALQLEKLKEILVALELETERLNAKLIFAEVNIDIEKDLLKAKGFEERDLDSELGCGSWRP
ncbi:hypothetical protein TSUD_295540 [Trifolium subterraneum]|uniref:MATH domain-containing protein n=1 Tax=Trifolium subterraneum TaxID=3900 RepID=A0A2Z6NF56_TRISU|nr:hypothetical protein TSUD_295540 [Trifolium subterraneum]